MADLRENLATVVRDILVSGRELKGFVLIAIDESASQRAVVVRNLTALERAAMIGLLRLASGNLEKYSEEQDEKEQANAGHQESEGLRQAEGTSQN